MMSLNTYPILKVMGLRQARYVGLVKLIGSNKTGVF